MLLPSEALGMKSTLGAERSTSDQVGAQACAQARVARRLSVKRKILERSISDQVGAQAAALAQWRAA